MSNTNQVKEKRVIEATLYSDEGSEVKMSVLLFAMPSEIKSRIDLLIDEFIDAASEVLES